jgi:ubiquitin thioesterase OTU1
MESSLDEIGVKNGDSLLLETISSPPPSQQPQTLRFQRKEIADDNSCLFNSIGYVLLDHDLSQSDFLRQIVVSIISQSENSEKYSEVVLGMPRHQYCAKMLDRGTWGGAIELAIFAEYFAAEIVAIDVETLTPMVFGESSNRF